MTALSIVQNACGEMALPIPSVLFSSTNDLDIQLRNILNREVKELARRAEWTKLQTETTFTTVAQAVQTSAVPSDFDYYINDTMYNRTTNRKVIGPLSVAEWQREKAGPIYSSVHDAFRFRGGDIIITPNPTAGETVAYEYITNLICTDSGATGQTEYAADDDLSLLSESIIELGIIWRFKKSKGFDYAEDFINYETALAREMARDGGKKRLDLSNRRSRSIRAFNIPEGNWS